MTSIKDKYCIVGVGETVYSKAAGRSTLSMACEAVNKALADAGLTAQDVDALTTYQINDSNSSLTLGQALGIPMTYWVDMEGGGSSVEALVGHAVSLLECGYAKKGVVVWRSALGRTGVRFGGQSAQGGTSSQQVGYKLVGLAPMTGRNSPAQTMGAQCMRHMYEYGTTTRDLAEVAVSYRYNAGLNPKATMRKPITVEDHQASRWISKPFRLLDCCLESDVAAAMIIVPADRARDCRRPPVYIKGGVARFMVQTDHGGYRLNRAKELQDNIWGSVGYGPQDMDFTSAYDAFTFTSMLQFEIYGLCPIGEGGRYVQGGRLKIDGARPSNTGGGQLSEGYTNGINLLIEDVRQLRHGADDECPDCLDGKHTYDRDKGCRQLRKADLCIGMGYGSNIASSCVVMGSDKG